MMDIYDFFRKSSNWYVTVASDQPPFVFIKRARNFLRIDRNLFRFNSRPHKHSICSYGRSTRLVCFNYNSSHILLKTLLVGDSGTGKSAIIIRYVEDRFSDEFISTIGVDFKIKRIQIGEKIVQQQIWDTAGQERFRSITSSYYRLSNGVMIIFDVMNRESFDNINYWMEQTNKHSGQDAVKYIVGNKCDIPSSERAMTVEEGRALAQSLGCKYFEVSAKDNTGIDALFEEIATDMLAKVKTLPVPACMSATITATETKSSTCC